MPLCRPILFLGVLMRLPLSAWILSCFLTNVSATVVPKNIIFMIGDGMGPAQIAAYRHFKDDPKTPQVETTIFDQLLVGSVSTDPYDKKDEVTDSAAAATALSCGQKTYNGAICFDTQKKPLIPLFERAALKGKSTGVVVTSQINHATPAAFAAAVEERHQYDLIAKQYLDRKVNGKPILDVMLGGGIEYFRDGKDDLLKKFSKLGYQISIDEVSMQLLNNKAPIIGLYAKKGLKPYLDRKDTQITLSSLMDKALARLETNPKGFVMMIEGSQIDWASHDNDILDTVWETEEFAKAVQKASNYVKTHPDTLLLVTADHETGGLSLGANDEYYWNPVPLTNAKYSIPAMVKKFTQGTDIKKLSEDQGLVLSDVQLDKAKLIQPKGEKSSQIFLQSLFDTATNSGWTTHGHTGVDVWLMAKGTRSEDFRGHLNNDEIGKKLIEILE